MDRRLRGLIFLALVVLAGGAGFNIHKSEGSPSSGNRPDSTTATVVKGDIEDVVTAQGKLEPKEYVDVGAQVSGLLQKIHVEIGDVVKTGDLLAEIDPKIYDSRVQADEARIKTLNAQIAEQDAQVTQAIQKFNRNKNLIKAKAVSQEILQDSETALKIAQAQRAALQAQLEEAQSALDGDKANLGYTKIYAPMDGTVVLEDTREGQTLNASQSAPTIVQLADLDTMTVRAQVAEADVMRLKPAMPVWFTTLGARDKKWNGTVRQILPSPEIINDVVLYNVLVDVDNKDRQLMTGMSTQMFFVLAQAKDVPVLPVAALGKRLPKEDNEAGTAYQVRIVNGKQVTEQTIHVGLMDRKLAEIKDGLNEGDAVALAIPPQTVKSSSSKPPNGFQGGPRL